MPIVISAGDWTTRCIGKAADYNLMTDKSCSGSMGAFSMDTGGIKEILRFLLCRERSDIMKSISEKAAIAFIVILILGLSILLSEKQVEKEIAYSNEPAGPFEEVEGLEIERLFSGNDEDADGIDDLEDIIQGARADVENKSRYKDAYYRGGYPPEDEGVCTDVIWRAFRNSGYELKELIDEDIEKNTEEYKRVTESGGPDPNIDFRRIPNLVVFFDKYAVRLTNEILPGNKENLYQWQGGDIVVFGGRIKHIGIISDKRNKDGVPYLIHNSGPYPQEEDSLLYWNSISEITRHYRWIAE